MKICLISNLYSPYIIGGAEIYVERIARELSVRHEVFLITTAAWRGLNSLLPKRQVETGLNIYRFYPLNLYHAFRVKKTPVFIRPLWHMCDIWNPHAFIGIRDILRKVNPDIVHTHNLNGLSLGSVSSVLSLGLPLVHTCHDFSLLCPFATLNCPFRESGTCINPSHLCKIYRMLKKMFMDGKPDIVIFPSSATERIYFDNRFFLKTKKQILYYCIPELPLQKAQKKKENGHFNLLYVGQLVQHKGVHILIEAFKSISDPNLRLDIVGDGGYKKYLQEFAGNDPRIIFHGQVPASSIPPYYENADITIVPSLWQEVLGIVILESFSASTPVIASNIGGISEIVKPGHNGFLFESSDAKGLAVILERVIRNPELLKKLSFNARESAGEFTIGEHVGKLLKLYKEAHEINRRK